MTVNGANRMMMAAMTLLYMGPLLAGLSGFGWRAAPVFVLVYLLWDFVTKPHHWPRSRADWETGTLAQIIIRMLLQSAVVALLFGLSRGIGGMAGTITAVPLGLPILMSMAGVVIARGFWAAANAPDLEKAARRAAAEQEVARMDRDMPSGAKPAR